MTAETVGFVVNRFKKGHYPPIMLGNETRFLAEISWSNGGYRALIVNRPTNDLSDGEWFPKLTENGANEVYSEDVRGSGTSLFECRSEIAKACEGKLVVKFYMSLSTPCRPKTKYEEIHKFLLENPNTFYTNREIAQELNISEPTVRKYTRKLELEGKLKKLGKYNVVE